MEPTNLFYAPLGWCFILVVILYLGIDCAIVWRMSVDGDRRRSLKKMLLAFVPLLLLGIYEMVLCMAGAAAELHGNVSVLSVKLFICSSFFVLVFFQSVGFMADNFRHCALYQAVLYSVLLTADLLAWAIGMELSGYILMLLGMVVALMILFFSRFFNICIQRFDTMITIIKKDNFLEACTIISVILASSYIVMVSLFIHRSVLMGVVSLLMVLALHVRILYGICWSGGRGIKKSYKLVKYDNAQEQMLMDGQTVDDYKIIQRLILHFESHKPYLDSELKLADVSKQIYTNRTYLSRALNHRLSKNFNQFVNYYRVREACRLFIENPLIKINEMSSKSGFRNLSSFSTAFSLNLRYTPAEWCKEIRRRLNNNEHVSVEDYFK